MHGDCSYLVMGLSSLNEVFSCCYGTVFGETLHCKIHNIELPSGQLPTLIHHIGVLQSKNLNQFCKSIVLDGEEFYQMVLKLRTVAILTQITIIKCIANANNTELVHISFIESAHYGSKNKHASQWP